MNGLMQRSKGKDDRSHGTIVAVRSLTSARDYNATAGVHRGSARINPEKEDE
jgi:hypothetical protein